VPGEDLLLRPGWQTDAACLQYESRDCPALSGLNVANLARGPQAGRLRVHRGDHRRGPEPAELVRGAAGRAARDGAGDRDRIPAGLGPHYLKGMGLLINSRRGVWSLTDRGRTAAQAEIEPLHRAYRTKYSEELRLRRPRSAGGWSATPSNPGSTGPGSPSVTPVSQ
jgi:hypothetical protein